MKKFFWIAGAVVLVLALAVAGILVFSRNQCREIIVRFLDVGQGDAAIVQCGDRCMLIDGGPPSASRYVYSYLTETLKLKHIDYLVATHPDNDHVGGLSAALNACSVGKAYCSETEGDVKAFRSLLKTLKARGLELTVPKAGESFFLGSAKVEILGPITEYGDNNNNSLVLRISFGDVSFLFMGDAESRAEHDMLEAGQALGATVLKVGHHGSSSSTCYRFLREVMPQYAVISVGDNAYGHPTEETLSRLEDADVKLYRTDRDGTIVCRSDGHSLNFTVEKGQKN